MRAAAAHIHRCEVERVPPENLAVAVKSLSDRMASAQQQKRFVDLKRLRAWRWILIDRSLTGVSDARAAVGSYDYNTQIVSMVKGYVAIALDGSCPRSRASGES